MHSEDRDGGRMTYVREIVEAFKKGFPPSKIDRLVGVTTGTSHDVIVDCWRYASAKNGRSTC